MNDLVGIEIDQAGLGAGYDQAVGGECVAAGAQAVTIECRADIAAIGKAERGGTVPRFCGIAVVLQEGASALRDRRRQQDPDRFGNVAAVARQQFHRLVERGRVGAVLGEDGLALGWQR